MYFLFFVKVTRQHSNEKYILDFLFCQLVQLGEVGIKHPSISYFLSNVSIKNLHQFMNVESYSKPKV